MAAWSQCREPCQGFRGQDGTWGCRSPWSTWPSSTACLRSGSSDRCSRHRPYRIRNWCTRGCGSDRWTRSWSSCRFRRPDLGLQRCTPSSRVRGQFSCRASCSDRCGGWRKAWRWLPPGSCSSWGFPPRWSSGRSGIPGWTWAPSPWWRTCPWSFGWWSGPDTSFWNGSPNPSGPPAACGGRAKEARPLQEQSIVLPFWFVPACQRLRWCHPSWIRCALLRRPWETSGFQHCTSPAACSPTRRCHRRRGSCLESWSWWLSLRQKSALLRTSPSRTCRKRFRWTPWCCTWHGTCAGRGRCPATSSAPWSCWSYFHNRRWGLGFLLLSSPPFSLLLFL